MHKTLTYLLNKENNVINQLFLNVINLFNYKYFPKHFQKANEKKNLIEQWQNKISRIFKTV